MVVNDRNVFDSSAGKVGWLIAAIRQLLLVVGVVLYAGTAFAQAASEATQPPASQPLAAGEYTLGPGDKLRITVHESPDLTGEFLVSGSGFVSMPLIGEVQAGGLTVRQLADAIANKLTPDYLKNPRVSIEVLNFRPFDIIGEVNKPGSYPYRPGMTILNAVAMAGGFTYRANKDDLYIKRAKDPDGREVEATQETAVLPGDIIRVKERFF
ncbi:MAG: polysaccharide biosynthesis/export family protein [Candidatus Eiseniibacteriota bacterium]